MHGRGPVVGRLAVGGRDVAEVLVARTWPARARGMLARRPLPQAMWFVDETSVHGVGMLTGLDVAQLDARGTVLRVTTLHPFGLVPPLRRACDVLEAPLGSFARWGLHVGDVLTWSPPRVAPE